MAVSGQKRRRSHSFFTVHDYSIFVLDDLQFLVNPAIYSILTFLLEHLPPTIHLVIATRVDPLLPVARLRSRGELVEIRNEDLPFSEAETGDFLSQAMNLDLSQEDIRLLEQRTEGWIAGLQMAALSMQGRSDLSGFVREFAGNHRYIFDYLLEEVLQRESPEIQDLLLRASVLDRLCAELCKAVVESGEAGGRKNHEGLLYTVDSRYQDVLEYLDRAVRHGRKIPGAG